MQQVEPRPGDYRCPYCGTEDFFDSDGGALLVRQEPPAALSRPVVASRVRWLLILLGLLLGGAGVYYWAR